VSARPSIDVSELPATTLDSSAPIWWGVVGMILIEGTMFALMIASYLYLRLKQPEWPPPGVRPPPLALPTWTLGVLAASWATMVKTDRAVLRKDRRGVLVWITATIALGALAIVLRGLELRGLPFRWSDHAYGSIVWVTLVLHLGHLLASVGENLFLEVAVAKRGLDDKNRLDLRVNALYWYFVVASWAVLWALLDLSPRLL
jgi:cytochrome c oxidase subunit III